MVHCIEVIRKSGMNPVVCINAFHTDTKDEIADGQEVCREGRRPLRPSTHWADGGDGALELADAVIDACKDKSKFKFLYPIEMKLRDRVAKVAKEVYGATVFPGPPRPRLRPRCWKAIPSMMTMPP